MESLKKRILTEGHAVGSDRINVDGFINHQVDVKFLEAMGEEFAKAFQGIAVDKILTVEASGIALGIAASRAFGFVPVVFAKKAKPNTMTDECHCAEAMSFTKSEKRTLTVSSKYILPGENILIIDDFLAHGEAATALCRIIEAGEAKVAGVGVAICKERQGGLKLLRDKGYKVEPLALIKDIKDGEIIFG